MNINRHNYEEYFLLYADNELSKTEKKVVEIFVQENVDLKEEFLMIKLTINSPEEDMKLDDKSFLLKKESSSFINEDNYEQIFVLYYDNELSDEQKVETENFVAENQKFKTEFELIAKAKLTPDNSIVYPDKKQLYRKVNPGKVIPFILWRSLAAAVFIGFGLWIAAPYFNKNNITPTVAVNNANTIKKPGTTDTNITVEKPINEEQNVVSSIKKIEIKKIKKEEAGIKKLVLKEQKINENVIAKNNSNTKTQSIEQKIEEPKQIVDHQLATLSEPNKTSLAVIEKIENPSSTNNVKQHIDKIGPEAQNTIHAQTASYISDADPNNQNYVFYDVSSEEFRKSKVGGFLKKVKRIVERNNPITRIFPEEEKQIAAN